MKLPCLNKSTIYPPVQFESCLYNKIKTCLRLLLLVLIISFSLIDFWNTSDTESEVDLQLSTGGLDQDDDDFDFYG